MTFIDQRHERRVWVFGIVCCALFTGGLLAARFWLWGLA